MRFLTRRSRPEFGHDYQSNNWPDTIKMIQIRINGTIAPTPGPIVVNLVVFVNGCIINLFDQRENLLFENPLKCQTLDFSLSKPNIIIKKDVHLS